MKKAVINLAMAAVLAGVTVPVSAATAEEETQKKIEQLSAELNKLKSQVKKVEDKSLDKWLTIGGDYRFRVDSLRGSTATYTDAMGTFNNAQNTLQYNFFSDAAPGSAFWQSQLGGMMAFSQGMSQVRNYNQALAFLGQNQQMIQGLMQFAQPVSSYKPKNDLLYTNRFGLDLHAKATSNITVNSRLLMYKTFGSQDDNAMSGTYFGDRAGVFDGTIGHVPANGTLIVDRAYATWNNILDQGIWFSVGRRPSTNGTPEHLRLNEERPGNGGVPALMVDYAYDGIVLGWAPDIEPLTGAYAKLCYGRGFESGIKSGSNNLHDMDMMGLIVVPYDTDPLQLQVQWNRGFNIIDFPVMYTSAFGDTAPSTNLGNIDWLGLSAISTLKNVGPGRLNMFANFGWSQTHPNDNVSANAGFQGLLTGSFFSPEAANDKDGWAVLVGGRYDYEPTKTKFGAEYNHGSKNWITMSPAADDMWTGKYGTRGDVYEGYLIQELNLKPLSSHLAKAFFKVGYQYYDFDYTNSNNWVGAPQRIDDLQANSFLMLTPVKRAQDVYVTFEANF